MHDAVADVLEERQALSRSPAPGIAASVALHLALLALAVIIARRPATGPIRPMLNVRLAAQAPSTSTAKVSRPSAPTPVKAAPAPKPQPEVKTPEAPPAEKPKTKKPTEESLFGRSKEKPVAPQAPPASAAPVTGAQSPATTATPSSALATPGIGAAGVTGIEGGDFPYTAYVDRMVNLIASHWFRPRTEGERLTRIYFVVERDGRIRDWKLEESSGNGAFDRAALRAVIEASPLPPLPFGYSGSYIGIHLTFH